MTILFLWCPCFVAGASVCMIQWDPLLPLHPAQNLHPQLHLLPLNRKPSQSNLLVACWKCTQDLEFGKCWNGTSSVGLLWGAVNFHFSTIMLVYGRFYWSWQLKQSCHSRTEKEWKCMRREFYLLSCFLWAAFNITSSHSHLLQAGTEYHCFFPLITGLFLAHNQWAPCSYWAAELFIAKQWSIIAAFIM